MFTVFHKATVIHRRKYESTQKCPSSDDRILCDNRNALYFALRRRIYLPVHITGFIPAVRFASPGRAVISPGIRLRLPIATAALSVKLCLLCLHCKMPERTPPAPSVCTISPQFCIIPVYGMPTYYRSLSPFQCVCSSLCQIALL